MRYLPTILLAVILGFILSKNFLSNWNPEFQFWHECITKKRTDLAYLQESHDRVVIFSGGSTCAFSIDPPTLAQKASIPAYNLGGAVPMGARYLMFMAMEEARSGDILVMGLEPLFLTTDEGAEEKALGISLVAADSQNGTPVMALGWDDLLLKRRPGAQFMATFWAKKIMKYPGYRYNMGGFREGGRISTDYRLEKVVPKGVLPPQKLSEQGIDLLKDITKRAKDKGVKLLYTLPWTFTLKEFADHNRALNQDLLRQIEEFMPVIDDPFLGVHTEESFFADTSNHLTDEGAKARSEAISPSLKKLIHSP